MSRWLFLTSLIGLLLSFAGIPQPTLAANRLVGGGLGVAGLFSTNEDPHLLGRAEGAQLVGQHSFVFVRVEYLRPPVEPTTLASGSSPSPDLRFHYAARVDMIPITAGLGLGTWKTALGPHLAFGPSLVWSRWNYDDEFFSVLSYVRVLVGFQVSAGVHLKVSERARIALDVTKYWTEESTSEKLDAIGAWDYPGFRQVGLSLGLACLL